MKNLYKSLGVKEDSSADDIKRAYRRLAKKFHPDSTGGDKAKEKRFKEVSEAYEVLGKPDKRAEYDQMRLGPQMPPGYSAAGRPDAGVWDLGDLFGQMFGGQRQGSGGSGSGGVEYQFYQGGFPGASAPGAGHVRRRPPQRTEKPKKAKPAKPKSRKVKASDGSVLVKTGTDTYSDVVVDFDQAVLGTAVDVPTLSGTASVRIPPGTSSGVKLRLKGQGAKGSGGKRGNHIVTVQIRAPKDLSADDKKTLTDLMRKLRKGN